MIKMLITAGIAGLFIGIMLAGLIASSATEDAYRAGYEEGMRSEREKQRRRDNPDD